MIILIRTKHGDAGLLLAQKIASYVSLKAPRLCDISGKRITSKNLERYILDEFDTDVIILVGAGCDDTRRFKNAVNIISDTRKVFGIAVSHYDSEDI